MSIFQRPTWTHRRPTKGTDAEILDCFCIGGKHQRDHQARRYSIFQATTWVNTRLLPHSDTCRAGLASSMYRIYFIFANDLYAGYTPNWLVGRPEHIRSPEFPGIICGRNRGIFSSCLGRSWRKSSGVQQVNSRVSTTPRFRFRPTTPRCADTGARHLLGAQPPKNAGRQWCRGQKKIPVEMFSSGECAH
jgi:hypothetical protein